MISVPAKLALRITELDCLISKVARQRDSKTNQTRLNELLRKDRVKKYLTTMYFSSPFAEQKRPYLVVVSNVPVGTGFRKIGSIPKCKAAIGEEERG